MCFPSRLTEVIAVWDSIGHMELMARLEGTFNIMLDAEDILAFSSFEKGKEILRKSSVELEFPSGTVSRSLRRWRANYLR